MAEEKEETKKKTTKKTTKKSVQSVSEPVQNAKSEKSGITYKVAPTVRIRHI